LSHLNLTLDKLASQSAPEPTMPNGVSRPSVSRSSDSKQCCGGKDFYDCDHTDDDDDHEDDNLFDLTQLALKLEVSKLQTHIDEQQAILETISRHTTNDISSVDPAVKLLEDKEDHQDDTCRLA
jgi:hypothetical protein